MTAAAFLYGKTGKPKAVYVADTLQEAERYASDWEHGVSYWSDEDEPAAPIVVAGQDPDPLDPHGHS